MSAKTPQPDRTCIHAFGSRCAAGCEISAMLPISPALASQHTCMWAEGCVTKHRSLRLLLP